MSVRPGTSVSLRTTPTVASAPSDTSVWFVVGMADQGPLTPQLIQSMSDFTRIFGARTSYSILYDAVDVYFREGGGSLYISRVVGPGAVLASVNLPGSGGTSLVANAIGPGTYANAYKVAVLAGTAGGYKIQVQDSAGNPLETSPEVPDQASGVAWGKTSQYIRLVLGAATGNPTVAAGVSLAGGTDDRSNATDSQWLAALTSFTADLGPGQVSMPGRTSDTAHQQLLQHANDLNRVALLDLPDSGSSSTLISSVTTGRGAYGKKGAAFAPWIVVPGVITNTSRTVPPSALVAAKCARVDSEFNANVPAAGMLGIAEYAFDVSQPAWDGPTRQNLNAGGVNVIRDMFGAPRIYGWRSMADPAAEPNWIDFGNSRLYMAIAAQANSIAEGYIFNQIDGQGTLIGQFGGSLTGMLLPYFNSGALYGATAPEAFNVDVGSQVNTPTTIANNELHAVIALRMSPFAELVVIEIVKVGITESV